MGKSVAAPPPVDYRGAAQAQGTANLEAARATAKLSNPNIIGPLGSQRVTYGAFDQAGYDKAMADFNASGAGQGTYDAAGNYIPGAAAPTKEQFTTDADIPTVTQTLTPEAQRTLEAQQKVDLALAELGQQGIGTAQRIMGTPFEYKGPSIQTQLGDTGQIAQGPNLGMYGMAGANVRAQGVNYGPMAGQYGMAGGGPSGGQFGMAGGLNQSLAGAGGTAGGTMVVDAQGNPLKGAEYDAEYLNSANPSDRAKYIQELGKNGIFFKEVAPRQAGAGPAAGLFGLQQGGVQGPQLQNRLEGVGNVNMGPNAGPQLQTGVTGPQLQGQLDTSGEVSGGPAEGRFGYAAGGPEGPQLQGRLDTSGLAAMPVGAGMTAQNAILSRLMPAVQAQRSQLETQLANQGLVRGGEAYNAAVAGQALKENDLLTQAALQGINLDMAARQQGLGEQQALGAFGNQAALQQFGAGQQAAQARNAAMAQNYQQALAQAQQGNAAQQQRFQQRVQAGEFGNAAQLAQFGAGLQAAQFGNQAQQQGFQNQQAIAQAQNQAQQQAFQQRLQAGEFGNQAQLAAFGANLQNQQAANQAAAANFAQAQAAQQMANQAAGQNFQQGVTGQQLQNAAIGQNFAQSQAAQQMYNQSVQQNMAMGLSAAQAQNQAAEQMYNQLMGIAGLQNQAVAQNQNAALQQQQAQNAAQAQQFNQAMQAAQFGNTAAQQALQQQLSLYNQPLNQISALMSGSQIQMPQFQGYTGANVAAAPIFQATQAAGQDAINRYNVAQSAQNAFTGGLFDLGGAAITKFSDRRLKSNIVRVGTHPRGFGVYEYDIFGRRERGVMAQEVQQIMPEAVMQHGSGYLMVNYGVL